MENEELVKRMLENEAAIKDLSTRVKALLEVLAKEGLVVPGDVDEKEQALLEESK